MTTAMRGNWFIALPVTGTRWFERRVMAPPESFRLMHPEDLHLTVFFLGAVGQQRAEEAWNQLVWSGRAMQIGLGHVVAMGSAQRYSALSARVTLGAEHIEHAIGECRDAVADAAQVARETRPPLAHVTIARASRRATAQDRERGIAWAKGLDLHQARIEVQEIALYTRAEPRAERQFQIVRRRRLP